MPSLIATTGHVSLTSIPPHFLPPLRTKLPPPTFRQLCLQDPKIVTKYRSVLHDQLTYQKVQDKLVILREHATNSTWTAADMETFQTLDDTIMQAMLYAEKSTSEKFSTKYDWSPQLQQAVEAHRFWTLCLKHARGYTVSPSTLERYRTKAQLEPQENLSVPKITQNLKAAYRTL